MNNLKESLKKDITQVLNEKGFKVGVDFSYITKANRSYNAITFREEGSAIGVTMDYDSISNDYKNGYDYEEMVTTLSRKVINSLKNTPSVEMDLLYDYEKAKQHLIFEAISSEDNAEYLKTVPHFIIEDIAFIYGIKFTDISGVAIITNDGMKQWKITPEQLHADALEIAPRINPICITSLKEVLFGMSKDADVDELPDIMYVATVPDSTNGAGVIAYPDFMERASEVVGGSFLLLPSSRHEAIILADKGDYESIRQMVSEINATQVDPCDKLTDSVYHYDSLNKIFELSERYEARIYGPGYKKAATFM